MKHVYYDIESEHYLPTEGETVCIAAAKETEDGITGTVLTREEKSEKELIDSFIDYLPSLDEEACIVTYNGDTFDWGFLVARAMTFDDFGETVDNLFKYKEEFDSHDLFKTHGQEDGSYLKLEELGKQNGIEHKVNCDGSLISSLYDRSRWGLIKKYAREDVRVTYKIYEKAVLDHS